MSVYRLLAAFPILVVFLIFILVGVNHHSRRIRLLIMFFRKMLDDKAIISPRENTKMI